MKTIDRVIAAGIVAYMDKRIAAADQPTDFRKSLRHAKFGLWRYRVRDDRIICLLDRERKAVVVQAIGHRRNVYN